MPQGVDVCCSKKPPTKAMMMDHGLEELDALLDLDLDDPATRLATANSEATIDLTASLREARERAGLRQRDVAERMGLKRQSSVADVERLGSDPRLSTLRRYATAIGARLDLTIATEERDNVVARLSSAADVWPQDQDATGWIDVEHLRDLTGA